MPPRLKKERCLPRDAAAAAAAAAACYGGGDAIAVVVDCGVAAKLRAARHRDGTPRMSSTSHRSEPSTTFERKREKRNRQHDG